MPRDRPRWSFWFWIENDDVKRCFFLGWLFYILGAIPLASQSGVGADFGFSDMGPSADLSFLQEVLRHKRVVVLGEFTHGSREINRLKVRLIQYLHEEMGYEVLLFESGIGELAAANVLRDQLSEQQMLRAGLFGPWRTDAYLDLMEYIKDRPQLTIGGVDVQRSGRAFQRLLATWLDQSGLDTSWVDLERRFTEVARRLQQRKDTMISQIGPTVEGLSADYRQLLAREPLHATKDGWSMLVKQTLRNRLAYLDYMWRFKAHPDYRRRFATRDSMMAENILWFADTIYPEKKVIVSGHNYHVARQNERELVFGEVLDTALDQSMYSIGIFAAEGRYSTNHGTVERMARPRHTEDIQHLAASAPFAISFRDIGDSDPGLKVWIDRPVIVNHSFVNLNGINELTLGTSFDGLILLKKTSPAQILSR